MKRAIIILLVLTTMIYGCSKDISEEKKLTQSEAEQLAMNRVYELTKDKSVYTEKGPSVYKITQEGDRWTIYVRVNNTIVRTNVYNNGTVKVFPTMIG